jgi:hypothetical protein
MDTRFRFTRDSAVLLAVNRVNRATYREFVNVDGLADEIVHQPRDVRRRIDRDRLARMGLAGDVPSGKVMRVAPATRRTGPIKETRAVR